MLRLCSSPNRDLVYNLYTYVWDLVGVLYLLQSYIDWLALGQFSPHYKQLIIGRHTWFSGTFELEMESFCMLNKKDNGPDSLKM